MPWTSRCRAQTGLRLSTELRQAQIADAALRIIAEKGLGQFTTLAVARDVGLTDGAVFRHFPTKAAVVLAAIERVGEILFEGFPPAHPDPLTRLGRFFRNRVAAVASHPGIGRLLFSEELAHAAGAEGAAQITAFKQRSVGFIRACLTEAEEAGQLAAPVTPRDGTILVVGALMALLYTGDLVPNPRRAPAEAERTWKTLERILRAREKTKSSAAEDTDPKPAAGKGQKRSAKANATP